jgi:hypothetical protein
MKSWWRSLFMRAALGMAFLLTGRAFDTATDGMPYAPLFWLLYYGGAATVDLFMFRVVRYFVSSHLQLDVEAICIASVATNALGWVLTLAEIPPDFYNSLIAGLNYALTIRILLGDSDVLDINYYRDRLFMVLRYLS